MAANKLRLSNLKLIWNCNSYNTYPRVLKLFYCTTKSENSEQSDVKKLGFAKFKEGEKEFLKPPEPKTETFVSLLRNSRFVDLGDPTGKVVIGRIYHVVGDDLYIDFGWKFPTVCTRPKRMEELFVKGARVRLLIKELELATTFLGSEKEITLNEADCVLLGLVGAGKSKT